MSDMRVCVISSGNGGAFKAFWRLAGLPVSQVLILTDRPCGIERFAADHGMAHERWEGLDNQAFSDRAAERIERFGGVDVVFLFFTRLVTGALFDRHRVINFHPSLLPAFSGFHAIERALATGVKFFGTTMHLADDTVDGGRILAQAVSPIKAGDDAASLGHTSFLHKVYFMLLVAEGFDESGGTGLDFAGWPIEAWVSPALRTQRYRDAFAAVASVDEGSAPPTR